MRGRTTSPGGGATLGRWARGGGAGGGGGAAMCSGGSDGTVSSPRPGPLLSIWNPGLCRSWDGDVGPPSKPPLPPTEVGASSLQLDGAGAAARGGVAGRGGGAGGAAGGAGRAGGAGARTATGGALGAGAGRRASLRRGAIGVGIGGGASRG